jgi:hypothetical protein
LKLSLVIFDETWVRFDCYTKLALPSNPSESGLEEDDEMKEESKGVSNGKPSNKTSLTILKLYELKHENVILAPQSCKLLLCYIARGIDSCARPMLNNAEVDQRKCISESK